MASKSKAKAGGPSRSAFVVSVDINRKKNTDIALQARDALIAYLKSAAAAGAAADGPAAAQFCTVPTTTCCIGGLTKADVSGGISSAVSSTVEAAAQQSASAVAAAEAAVAEYKEYLGKEEAFRKEMTAWIARKQAREAERLIREQSGQEVDDSADFGDDPEPTPLPPKPAAPALPPMRVKELPDLILLVGGVTDSVEEAESVLASAKPPPVHCVLELASRHISTPSPTPPLTTAPSESKDISEGAEGPAPEPVGPASVADVLRARTGVPLVGTVPKLNPMLWRDVLLLEIDVDRPNGSAKTGAELYEELLPALVSAASHYRVYVNMLESSVTISLPDAGLPEGPAAAGGEALVTGLSLYTELMDSTPPACVGVPTVVFALREAVVALLGDTEPETMEESLAELTDWSAKVLAPSLKEHVGLASDTGDHTPPDVSLPSFQIHDESLMRLTRGGLASCKAVGDLSIGTVPLPAAERAVVRTLSLAVPGGVSRLRMPATPTLLESKRGADRDEFMHFTKLSQPYVARTKAVMLAESMLRNADAKAAVFDKGGEPLTVSDKLNAYNWDLTNWSCYEALDGVALGQAYSEALWNHPTVVSKYDEATDSLIVSLHHSVPRRRIRTTRETVIDLSYAVRPDFPAWRAYQPAFQVPTRPSEVFVPGDDASADLVDESKTEPSLESLSKLKGSVLSSVADTASVHTQLGQPKTFLAVDSAFARGTGYTTDWLFPTDHSVVRVVKTLSGKQAWVSVSKDNHTFGLRRVESGSTDTTAQWWTAVGRSACGAEIPSPLLVAAPAAATGKKKGKGNVGTVEDSSVLSAVSAGSVDPESGEPKPKAKKGKAAAAPAPVDPKELYNTPSQWLFFASLTGDGCDALTMPTAPATVTVQGFPKPAAQKTGRVSLLCTVTQPDGLIVEQSSAGWIRQRRVLDAGIASPTWPTQAPEQARLTYGSTGAVARHLEGNVKQLLFPDGASSWWLPAGHRLPLLFRGCFPSSAVTVVRDGNRDLLEVTEARWLHIAATGATSTYVHGGANDGPAFSFPSHTTEDPSTGATIVVRYDVSVFPEEDRAPLSPVAEAPPSPVFQSAKVQKAAQRRERQMKILLAKYEADRAAISGSVWTGAGFGLADVNEPAVGPLGRVVSVLFKNGDILAVHPDGTHICTVMEVPHDIASEHRVVVACHGFATVEIDPTVHGDAMKHASGVRISAVKSGRLTRTVTTLADDTLLCLDYDSKVTAQINSYIRIHRPDGVCIQAHDDGVVQFRPRDVPGNFKVVGAGVGQPFREPYEAADEAASPKHSLTDSEEDNSLGVFVFNVFEGSLTMTDEFRNTFAVTNGSAASVRLSGAMDSRSSGTTSVLPKITNPIQPRLFFMQGTGVGFELLSPQRWSRLREVAVPLTSTFALLPGGPATGQGLERVSAPSTLPAPSAGFGRGNLVLPGLNRGQLLPQFTVPDPYSDEKLTQFSDPPASAYVLTVRMAGGGYDSAATNVSNVGLLNRSGRLELWGSVRGWISSRPGAESGRAKAHAAATVFAALGNFTTFKATSGASAIAPPALPPTRPKTSSSKSGGALLGAWLACRLPELVSRNVASQPLGAGVVRTAVGWREVVEVQQASAAARKGLEDDGLQYQAFLAAVKNDDTKFNVDDPRPQEVRDAEVDIAKQVLKLRRTQARQLKSKADADAKSAQAAADLAQRTEERRLQRLARQQAEEQSKKDAVEQATGLAASGGRNAGTKVGVKAGPLVDALPANERASVREAMLAKARTTKPPVAVAVSATVSAAPAPVPAPANASTQQPSAPRVPAASGTAASPLQKRVKGRANLTLESTTPSQSDASTASAPVLFPVTQGLRFAPTSVDFGSVNAGAVYRFDVAVENGTETPLPCTVPSHYLYHNAEFDGDDTDVPNTVCVCLPDDEQLGLLQGGDVRVFEVELVASSPGEVLESLEFQSAGFTAVLLVRAVVLPVDAPASPHPEVRQLD